jgi:hypothetical protein
MPVPEVIPLDVPEFSHESFAEISVTGGGLTLWSTAETAPELGPTTTLRMDPRAPVIIGRQEGGRIPYMDPHYRSTQIGPDGQSVLTPCGEGMDLSVSRGHFMLRCSSGGIRFVNSVPRRGDSIRPPLNGARLWSRLAAFKCLQDLNLQHCRVSTEGIEQLQRASPTCASGAEQG